jgi:hypothetical protein
MREQLEKLQETYDQVQYRMSLLINMSEESHQDLYNELYAYRRELARDMVRLEAQIVLGESHE